MPPGLLLLNANGCRKGTHCIFKYYRPFACKTFTLSEPVTVMPRQLNIAEGTCPYFEDP